MRGPLRRHWAALPRSVRFVLVGSVNTLFGYGAYALLLLVGLDYVAAAFVATIAAVLFNYLTTGGLVFERLSGGALLRFVGVYVLTYAINVGCVGLLGRGGVNAYLAGLVLLAPMAALTYLLMSRLVFGVRRAAD